VAVGLAAFSTFVLNETNDVALVVKMKAPSMSPQQINTALDWVKRQIKHCVEDNNQSPWLRTAYILKMLEQFWRAYNLPRVPVVVPSGLSGRVLAAIREIQTDPESTRAVSVYDLGKIEQIMEEQPTMRGITAVGAFLYRHHPRTDFVVRGVPLRLGLPQDLVPDSSAGIVSAMAWVKKMLTSCVQDFRQDPDQDVQKLGALALGVVDWFWHRYDLPQLDDRNGGLTDIAEYAARVQEDIEEKVRGRVAKAKAAAGPPGVASGAPPTARPGGGDGMPGSSSGPDAPPVAAVPKVTVTVAQGRKKVPVPFDAGKTIADLKGHLEKNPVGLKGTVTAVRMTFLDGNKEPMPDETVINEDLLVSITLSNAYLKHEASNTDSEAPAAKKQREGKDFMKKVFEGHPINTDLELDMVRAEKLLLQQQFYYHMRQGHREVSCDIYEKMKVLNVAIRNFLQHQDTRVNLLMNHERRASETSVGFDQAMHLASGADPGNRGLPQHGAALDHRGAGRLQRPVRAKPPGREPVRARSSGVPPWARARNREHGRASKSPSGHQRRKEPSVSECPESRTPSEVGDPRSAETLGARRPSDRG
jgi:hypothetical protein